MNQEYTMQYGPGGQPWESGPRNDEMSGIEIVGITLAVAVVIAWGLFWLWMIIDLLKRKSMDGTNKLIWLVVLVFINVIGVLLYFFMVYRPERKAMKPAAAPMPSSGMTGQN